MLTAKMRCSGCLYLAILENYQTNPFWNEYEYSLGLSELKQEGGMPIAAGKILTLLYFPE